MRCFDTEARRDTPNRTPLPVLLRESHSCRLGLGSENATLPQSKES
jgi:hypothetical protein